jgi:hypothetical protein
MDIVKKVLVSYKKLLPLYESHLTKLSQAYKQNYTLISDAKLAIDDARDIIKNTEKHVSGKPTPVSVFATSHGVINITTVISTMHSNLNMDANTSDMAMSGSYIADLAEEYVGLDKQLTKIKQSLKLAELSTELFTHIETLDAKTAHGLYVKYPSSTHLYAHYIQQSLDKTGVDDTVINMLEEAKNDAMGRDITPSANKMQRFGLISVFQHVSAKEVLEKVLNVLYQQSREDKKTYGGSSTTYVVPQEIKKIAKVMREKHVGLYLIANVSDTRIKYSLNNLMLKRVASKFPITDTTSVNPMVLGKYNTIELLSSDKQTTPRAVFKLGDVDATKWVILRTLDGVHYDIMSNSKFNIFVTNHVVRRMDRGSSTRIRGYQNIMDDRLKQHLMQPVEIDVDESGSPMSDIVRDLSLRINAFIDTRLDETPPRNLKELVEVMTGDDIENITSNILIASYGLFNDSKSSDRMPLEMASTFLYNIENIVHSFVRKIRETFAKSKLTEFIFVEKTDQSLYVYIRTHLRTIVSDSITKIFDPDQDIYESTQIKQNVLKTELHQFIQ